MPSIRGQLFYWFLRLSSRQAGGKTTLSQQRAELEKGARNLRMPGKIEVKPVSVGKMPAEWLCPLGASEQRAILYLHGGAYTMGSCNTHRALASRIAVASQSPVLLPEFRRAPEFPFPATLEDAVSAYGWLIEQGTSPQKIAIVGDSSGGGLAIALAVFLRDRNVALPGAIVCLSPWADLELTGETLTTRARVDPICSIEQSRLHASHYLGQHDARDPLVSPIYADLHGLPPVLIQVGEREILLSDATRLAENARGAGVDTHLEVWGGMWHVWHLFAGYVPEAQQAIDRVGAFIHPDDSCQESGKYWKNSACEG